MITVFTPSYNRASNLNNLYLSLLSQNALFEWLIVDDGSTDDTKEFIGSLINEGKINIRYVYKKNGGKQSAYNLGLQEALGDIFICVDSDDILDSDCLSEIEKDFASLDRDLAGIMYNQGYINNKKKLIGQSLPNDVISTYYDIYHKLEVTGDKLIVFRTDVAKKFPFPIIEGEKFIPEALIYNRMSCDYKFMCKDKIMAYKEYLDNGYSANYFSLVKQNPKGNALYYLEAYQFDKSFYNVYGYLLFSFYGKVKFNEIIKHPSKLKVLFMYIPVFMISKIRK